MAGKVQERGKRWEAKQLVYGMVKPSSVDDVEDAGPNSRHKRVLSTPSQKTYTLFNYLEGSTTFKKYIFVINLISKLVIYLQILITINKHPPSSYLSSLLTVNKQTHRSYFSLPFLTYCLKINNVKSQKRPGNDFIEKYLAGTCRIIVVYLFLTFCVFVLLSGREN